MFEYSEKEINMIRAINPNAVNYANQLDPSRLFDILASHAFLYQVDNWATNSLRRLMIQFNKPDNKIWRNTPEWDGLIY